MIDKINNKIQQVNKKIGVDMRLPETTQPKLEQYSLINLLAGSSLLIVGLATGLKGSLVLGGLAIASSLAMRHEAKKK